jgi:putative transcriptional regulator
MVMTEKALAARDKKRDIGAELLQSVRNVKAGVIGKVNMVDVSIAAEARQRLGLSQSQFAGMLGVSVRTFQDWEQGRREPSGAAKSLLRVAALRPDAVHEALTDGMAMA